MSHAMNNATTKPKRARNGVGSGEFVRALCLKSLRIERAYSKIDRDAVQIWASSEKKGAALLARRILRVLKRPNTKMTHADLPDARSPDVAT